MLQPASLRGTAERGTAATGYRGAFVNGTLDLQSVCFCIPLWAIKFPISIIEIQQNIFQILAHSLRGWEREIHP